MGAVFFCRILGLRWRQTGRRLGSALVSWRVAGSRLTVVAPATPSVRGGELLSHHARLGHGDAAPTRSCGPLLQRRARPGRHAGTCAAREVMSVQRNSGARRRTREPRSSPRRRCSPRACRSSGPRRSPRAWRSSGTSTEIPAPSRIRLAACIEDDLRCKPPLSPPHPRTASSTRQRAPSRTAPDRASCGAAQPRRRSREPRRGSGRVARRAPGAARARRRPPRAEAAQLGARRVSSSRSGPRNRSRLADTRALSERQAGSTRPAAFGL
jgi:hypothetical protein